MRALTSRELDSLHTGGRCPFCGGEEFYEGPSGGIAMNWFCGNELCGAGFNITPVRELGGQLIKEPRREPVPTKPVVRLAYSAPPSRWERLRQWVALRIQGRLTKP